MLQKYIDKKQVPRGLRLFKSCSVKDNSDLLNKWEEALSDCSHILMKILISHRKTLIEQTTKEIENIQMSLEKFKNSQLYDELNDMVLKKTDSYQKDLINVKNRKIIRDEEDYLKGEVYSFNKKKINQCSGQIPQDPSPDDQTISTNSSNGWTLVSHHKKKRRNKNKNKNQSTNNYSNNNPDPLELRYSDHSNGYDQQNICHHEDHSNERFSQFKDNDFRPRHQTSNNHYRRPKDNSSYENFSSYTNKVREYTTQRTPGHTPHYRESRSRGDNYQNNHCDYGRRHEHNHNYQQYDRRYEHNSNHQQHDRRPSYNYERSNRPTTTVGGQQSGLINQGGQHPNIANQEGGLRIPTRDNENHHFNQGAPSNLNNRQLNTNSPNHFLEQGPRMPSWKQKSISSYLEPVVSLITPQKGKRPHGQEDTEDGEQPSKRQNYRH
ncbi:GATA zinc finger domain-containing protein 14-like [Bombina bombina]|uniref:GATA zinc finger domain-containing protein 14-like n=1 Tax=Bombina bombina TaxID=8345 RepID=UPI00235A7971|nr:GATA zinc finger domain-containing protein 14-like [Bombina bombina]